MGALFDDSPYGTIADKWVLDGIRVRPSDVPESVYHYTDAGGLLGMLQSGEVWLTDHRFLNDTTEFAYFFSLLSEFKKQAFSSSSGKSFKKSILSRISYEHEGELESYVFSCSTERDDLSQWRGYASEGQGFTLGLDASSVYDFSCKDNSQFAFSRVSYDAAEQMLVLGRALDELVGQVKQDMDNKDDEGEALEAAGRALDYITLNRAALSKHQSFRSENEWRVVAYSNLSMDEIKVRAAGKRLIPYLPQKLSPDGRLPLKSVGIGPAFVASEIVDAVRTLLKINGYDVPVYFADTPYRRS